MKEISKQKLLSIINESMHEVDMDEMAHLKGPFSIGKGNPEFYGPDNATPNSPLITDPKKTDIFKKVLDKESRKPSSPLYFRYPEPGQPAVPDGYIVRDEGKRYAFLLIPASEDDDQIKNEIKKYKEEHKHWIQDQVLPRVENNTKEILFVPFEIRGGGKPSGWHKPKYFNTFLELAYTFNGKKFGEFDEYEHVPGESPSDAKLILTKMQREMRNQYVSSGINQAMVDNHLPELPMQDQIYGSRRTQLNRQATAEITRDKIHWEGHNILPYNSVGELLQTISSKYTNQEIPPKNNAIAQQRLHNKVTKKNSLFTGINVGIGCQMVIDGVKTGETTFKWSGYLAVMLGTNGDMLAPIVYTPYSIESTLTKNEEGEYFGIGELPTHNEHFTVFREFLKNIFERSVTQVSNAVSFIEESLAPLLGLPSEKEPTPPEEPLSTTEPMNKPSKVTVKQPNKKGIKKQTDLNIQEEIEKLTDKVLKELKKKK